MTMQTSTDLRQLAETVNRLSQALAANERRHTASMRAVRWGALASIVLVVGVFYAASESIKAYATASQMLPWAQMQKQIADQQPPSLNDILQSLMATKELQGALVKTMQSASTIAARETQDSDIGKCVRDRYAQGSDHTLCFAETQVDDLGEFFLEENGELPQPGDTPEAQMAYGKKMMEATLMAFGQAMVDGTVLLHRLRRDSDRFRGTVVDIGGTDEMLNGIRNELQLMNGMLRSIPAMATEMNVMNRQMSVMSHGVGSTMGRMGNMLPW